MIDKDTIIEKDLASNIFRLLTTPNGLNARIKI